MYECSKCKNKKLATEFLKSTANKNRDELTFWCRECHKAQYHKSKERLFNTYSLDRKLRAAYNGAKRRSRDKNNFFDLDLSDLYLLWNRQNGRCAITNMEMTYQHFCGRLNTNLSLDRIDSSLPYIKDNIQLVCMVANQMKNDLNMSDFIDLCKLIILNNETSIRTKRT